MARHTVYLVTIYIAIVNISETMSRRFNHYDKRKTAIDHRRKQSMSTTDRLQIIETALNCQQKGNNCNTISLHLQNNDGFEEMHNANRHLNKNIILERNNHIESLNVEVAKRKERLSINGAIKILSDLLHHHVSNSKLSYEVRINHKTLKEKGK